MDTGTLWAGFAVADCTDPSGDPVVLYDQFADRWLLSQFTTRRRADSTTTASRSRRPATHRCLLPLCLLTQETAPRGYNFPDYPKYGVWKDSYVLTTRDFGPTVEYGISVYALEKNKMINGQAKARAVQFFLDSNTRPPAARG